jgi:uncharacterized protein YndB with AHSA1/START domain
MKDSIEHKLFFPQPPHAVWAYLTQPDLMELWLMKNDLEPVVGRHFRFTTSPVPQLDFDGMIHCTVLEVTPYTKLSYTWQTGPEPGVITVDSVVTWTLQPRDGGTELLLLHNGMKDAGHLAIFSAMDAGWLKNIQKIAELLNNAADATNRA